MTAEKKEVPMGAPDSLEDLPPVGGINEWDREDFEYARLEKDPTDPSKGEPPTYIVRAAEAREKRSGK